jgi:hypothetical protein
MRLPVLIAVESRSWHMLRRERSISLRGAVGNRRRVRSCGAIQNQDNYYIVRADAREDNVVCMYKVEAGKRLDRPDKREVRTYGKKSDVPSVRNSDNRELRREESRETCARMAALATRSATTECTGVVGDTPKTALAVNGRPTPLAGPSTSPLRTARGSLRRQACRDQRRQRPSRPSARSRQRPRPPCPHVRSSSCQ